MNLFYENYFFQLFDTEYLKLNLLGPYVFLLLLNNGELKKHVEEILKTLMKKTLNSLI